LIKNHAFFACVLPGFFCIIFPAEMLNTPAGYGVTNMCRGVSRAKIDPRQ
jgi:hypothetical protein